MAYPSSIDSYTPSSGTSLLTSPDHSGQHNQVGSAMVFLETKVGMTGGSPIANAILQGSGNGTSIWTTSLNNLSFGTPAITGGTITASVLNAVIGTATANNLIANGLNTSSGSQVIVSTANAPTNGQALVATSGTSASWQGFAANAFLGIVVLNSGSGSVANSTPVTVVAGTIVSTGTCHVLVLTNYSSSTSLPGVQTYTQLVIDGGTVVPGQEGGQWFVNASQVQSTDIHYFGTIGSGTHVISLQTWTVNSGTVTFQAARLSIIPFS